MNEKKNQGKNNNNTFFFNIYIKKRLKLFNLIKLIRNNLKNW